MLIYVLLSYVAPSVSLSLDPLGLLLLLGPSAQQLIHEALRVSGLELLLQLPLALLICQITHKAGVT